MRGKVDSLRHNDVLHGDHPRVCGEKPMTAISSTPTRGSPPRMRGKVLLSKNHLLGLGITPAYAGKSRKGEPKWHTVLDHPRVCGEKSCQTGELSSALGSPPRMRGKD